MAFVNVSDLNKQFGQTHVLKGVSLGTGCVVAAGALVTRDAPEGQLLVGAPARSHGSVEWQMR